MEEDFGAGLQEIAAALRTRGLKPNAGQAAFVLRARARIKELEDVLRGFRSHSCEEDCEIIDAVLGE